MQAFGREYMETTDFTIPLFSLFSHSMLLDRAISN